MSEQLFWVRGSSMRKFHAVTYGDGHSKCGFWFMGGRALVDDIDVLRPEDREKAKCKACIEA